MESLAYINYQSMLEGSMLTTIGDLKLIQRQPLNHKGIDERYNVSSFGILFLQFSYKQFVADPESLKLGRVAPKP